MTIDIRPRIAALACAAAATITGLAGCAIGGTPTAPSTRGTTTTAAPTVAAAAGAAASSTDKYGVKVDALENGTTLRTTEGKAYQLPETATYVVRIPGGWLYGKSTGPSPVYLLNADGIARPLAATIDQQSFEMPALPVVSADGTRIAWATTGAVHTGQITADGLVDIVYSPVQSDTYPLTWAGTRVILAHSYGPGCCGYRHAEYDVWDPTAGAFVPHWTQGIAPIYGPVSAGGDLFALQQTSATGDGCLARLDAVKDLSATATVCSLGLRSGSLMWSLAPDGRHLVDLASGMQDQLEMFDLTTVAQTKAPLHSCLGDTPLLWEDNATLLVANESTHAVYRCAVNDGDSGPVAGLTLDTTTQAVRFVPRIGVS
jgi:hypothetical protein